MGNDVVVTPGLRRSPTQRRKFVALSVKAGKSNRAIAQELDVDEGTIRRDRRFLAAPENEWPVKVPRPKKAKKARPVLELEPAELRKRRLKEMVKVLQRW